MRQLLALDVPSNGSKLVRCELLELDVRHPFNWLEQGPLPLHSYDGQAAGTILASSCGLRPDLERYPTRD